jgi:hypothetical protein
VGFQPPPAKVDLSIMITAQPAGPSDRVDHRTPEPHWSGECRHWVVDCDQVVSPLPIAHVAVNDGWIRSLSYDRRHGRLEIDSDGTTQPNSGRFRRYSLESFGAVNRNTSSYIESLVTIACGGLTCGQRARCWFRCCGPCLAVYCKSVFSRRVA